MGADTVIDGAGEESEPLVSVLIFCKNAADTIRRSIESVQRQSYRNFEYVVQDGASTDGTLDILREYQGKMNMKLVSAPDNGPADAFWQALQRCEGKILATCLADEELMPDSLEYAVSVFQKKPYLGVITGDAYCTDKDGRITSKHTSEPFSFTRYLTAEYCPYWSSSFFNMRALRNVGLFENRWSKDSLEFEIWCRLAEDYEVYYVPKILSKYGIHAEQLSNLGVRALQELESRIEILQKYVIRPDGVFGDDRSWANTCTLLQCANLCRHLRAYNSPHAVAVLERIERSDWLDEFRNWARTASAADFERLGSGEIRYRILGGNSSKAIRIAAATALYRALVPVRFRAMIGTDVKAWVARRLAGVDIASNSVVVNALHPPGKRRGRRVASALGFLISPKRRFRD